MYQSTKPKPFTWSWSRLKNYRTCPKRHYELDILKKIVEPPSEQMTWGNTFHAGMANYIGKGTPLPATMKRYSAWPDNLIKLKNSGYATVLVEQKLAMDNQFQATAYFDPHTWFRSVADVLVTIPHTRSAITVDWKTGGKVQPEFEQLALSAQTVFAHHEDIDQVVAYYVWAGHDVETKETYTREGMLQTWSHILPEVRRMEESAKNMDYPPTPSGLCKSYCPVTHCPYHGRGSN
jgi:PD-(D/E)XK nuclease superfamily